MVAKSRIKWGIENYIDGKMNRIRDQKIIYFSYEINLQTVLQAFQINLHEER